MESSMKWIMEDLYYQFPNKQQLHEGKKGCPTIGNIIKYLGYLMDSWRSADGHITKVSFFWKFLSSRNQGLEESLI